MLSLDDLILHEVCQGLPIVSEPYAALAQKIGVSEERVMQVIEKAQSSRILRRLGPVAQHRQFGYHHNAMLVFCIEDQIISQVGQYIQHKPYITLCYQRRSHTNWPYNLYAMIHGQDRSEVNLQINELVLDLNREFELRNLDYQVLFSARHFKQTGANYLGLFLEHLDRTLLNEYQQGIPITMRPFQQMSERFDVSEEFIVSRLHTFRLQHKISRFGPMYNVEKFGGVFTLVAMEVPAERFDQVNEMVNSFKEVAHNYERDHKLNMWFVVATETQEQTDMILQKIKVETKLQPQPLPKLEEYYLNLRFDI